MDTKRCGNLAWFSLELWPTVAQVYITFIMSSEKHLGEFRLRTVLLSRTSYPLDERLDLAKRLTSSILFVHTVQFVHKNIRPETIIIFQNEHSHIGAPFLAGFEQFRVEDGNTYRVGDDMWQHNLCKIPPNFPVIMLTSCQIVIQVVKAHTQKWITKCNMTSTVWVL